RSLHHEQRTVRAEIAIGQERSRDALGWLEGKQIVGTKVLACCEIVTIRFDHSLAAEFIDDWRAEDRDLPRLGRRKQDARHVVGLGGQRNQILAQFGFWRRYWIDLGVP